MPLSHDAANKVLKHLLGIAAWTQPPAVYLGLSSTTPARDGSNVTEPSGGGYARKLINPSDWASVANSATENAVDLIFGTASATWLAGANLVAFVLYDAASSGNFLGYKLIDAAKPVYISDVAKFLAGALDLTLAGAD